MKIVTLLSLVAGLLLTTIAANAYPTLAGYTGTGVLPDAYVAPVGQFQLAADWYDTDGSGLATDSTYPGRVLYGIVENWEIGGGYSLSEISGGDANTWNANLKYIIPIASGGFTTAIGGRYASTDLDVTGTTNSMTNAYLVGSYIFGSSSTCFSGTLGANWTQFDPDVGDSADAFRAFAGLEATFGNALAIAGDIQTEDEDLDTDPLYSVVLRAGSTRSLMGQVGYTNADITGVNGTDESNIFAGLCLFFGGEEVTETTSTGGYGTGGY